MNEALLAFVVFIAVVAVVAPVITYWVWKQSKKENGITT